MCLVGLRLVGLRHYSVGEVGSERLPCPTMSLSFSDSHSRAHTHTTQQGGEGSLMAVVMGIVRRPDGKASGIEHRANTPPPLLQAYLHVNLRVSLCVCACVCMCVRVHVHVRKCVRDLCLGRLVDS